ncbi:MAG TPA: hypothetical protein VHP34_01700 [Alphaproteobacteria bacterium]|nr:hypothetical protein [Alphaproteobacteria bacterium]
MRFERVFTKPDIDPFDTVAFRRLTTDAGETVTVPAPWGSVAVDVLVGQVFYPHALPPVTRRAGGHPLGARLPDFLWPQEVDPDSDVTAPRFERDMRDVMHRVAGGLAYHAFCAGLLDSADDARIFYDELRYILLHRMALPEISLLATAGLQWAYGLEEAPRYRPSESISAFPADFSKATALRGTLAIEAQTKITDLQKRLRILAEIQALENPDAPPLTVTIPAEHGESLALTDMLLQAEVSRVAEDLGRRLLETASHDVMDACDRDAVRGFDPAFNSRLSRIMTEMRAAGTPEAVLHRALAYAEQGFENIHQYAVTPDAETATVPDVILSVSDELIETALTGHGFLLVEAGQAKEHADAAKLWDRISEAVWSSGAPQLFFRDSAGMDDADNLLSPTAQRKVLSPTATGGLVFTPDVSAPAATVNLAALVTDTDRAGMLDAAQLQHTARIMTFALEAAFDAGDFSAASQAQRPLVIGASGLSTLLMSAGIVYDSTPGQVLAAQAVALLTGACLAASAEMADKIGACDDYAADAAKHLAAMKAKIAALAGASGTAKGVMRRQPVLNSTLSPDPDLARAVEVVWDKAYHLGKEQGFRHLHVTGLATPLPLQGLMGVTARDIAPESSLIRFEGFFGDDNADVNAVYGKEINPAVMQGLKRLGYSTAQIEDIYAYAIGHGTLLDAPMINHRTLAAKGLPVEAIAAVEKALPAAQHVSYAFNRWTLGAAFDDFVVYNDDFLGALGFSEDDIDAANLYACGAMTIEGAPHLKPDHLAVFDCLLPGGFGVRRVSPEAQIRMQAAVEPFLSGAALQTLSLDHHVDIADVQRLLLLGWELGVKRLRLWREGSSLLHPALALPKKWETSLFAEEEEERARTRRSGGLG